jgi:hypothetical protein
MASKGKKTKHVIQDTGEMSDSNYSKLLVEMGVGRPILPHEIELKNLSEEEIATGIWTVKQMFGYLEYMQDFCGMPDNEPSIFISQVSKYDTKKRILSNFKAQKLGVIENIDLFPQSKDSFHNRAFVHFKDWNTYYIDPPGTTHISLSTIQQTIDRFIAKNKNAIRTRFALITGKKLKLYYDKHDKSAFVEIMALRPEHLE